MKKYTLKDFAEQVIHENAEPMTASEIWQYGLNKGMIKKEVLLVKHLGSLLAEK